MCKSWICIRLFIYLTFLLRLLCDTWIMNCFSSASFVIVGSEVKLVPFFLYVSRFVVLNVLSVEGVHNSVVFSFTFQVGASKSTNLSEAQEQ